MKTLFLVVFAVASLSSFAFVETVKCVQVANSWFIKNTVGTVMEYIICSANVIESWSYVSKEHFDEILKDYNWMTSKDFKDWEAYSKRSGKDDFVGNNVDATQLGTDFRP